MNTTKMQNLVLKVAVIVFALLVCIGAVHTWNSRRAAVVTTGTVPKAQNSAQDSAQPSFLEMHLKAHQENLQVPE